jgi:hypothetical protein
VKALTLHQPWASLVALGVKTIETRSWAAPRSLVGQHIAIHAGKRELPVGGIHVPAIKHDGSRAERDAWNHQTWLAINTITDPEFQGPQQCNPTTGRQRRIPKRAQTPTLMWPHAGPHHRPRVDKPQYTHTEHLPLGAIVATARLALCIPIVALPYGARFVDEVFDELVEVPMAVAVGDGVLWHKVGDSVADVTDQLPYGHYEPGRWAWLLDDIKPTTEQCPACMGAGWLGWLEDAPGTWLWDAGGGRPPYGYVCPTCDGNGFCDPIPAKGKQRLWTWMP